MTTDAIGDKLVREVILLKYSDMLRFYYLSRMTNSEVCLFKVWDSDKEVCGKGEPTLTSKHVTGRED